MSLGTMSDLFMNMQRQRIKRTTPTFAREQNNNASFSSNSTQASEQMPLPANADAAEDDVDDAFANILSLKLRKPKHWNWELSTSRSCSNIALPRILLYDHKGTLLVDADSQQEQVYTPPAIRAPRAYTNHAATVNLAQSIRQALEQEFNGLQIAEATPSPLNSTATTPSPSRHSAHAIDINTYELPDYKLERRSNSLKGVRFKDDYQPAPVELFNLINIPTPPSTTTTTTTTPTTASNSSNGPREKRRFRRTQSSSRSPAQSESILERFSYHKGRFSSPEFADEQVLYKAPRYYLRTSKAGTLIVQEDSFSRYRRRRRQRHSSSDNLPNSSKNQSLSSLRSATCQLPVADAPPATANAPKQSTRSRSRRRSQQPIRHYRSDANVLLTNHSSSTSDEEQPGNVTITSHQPSNNSANRKRKSKRELVRLDSGVSSAYTGR